jgi:hypothetical protein
MDRNLPLTSRTNREKEEELAGGMASSYRFRHRKGGFGKFETGTRGFSWGK